MQAEITLKGLQPYLSFLGTFIQLGAILLLIALFGLLRRYARRRRYFRTWSNAWVALALALAAVVVRYNLLPSLMAGPVLDDAFNTKLLHFVYQCAKFYFYGLLVAGTLRYVRSSPGYTAMVGAGSFGVLYAALSVWQSASLGDAVVWQAPVATGALGFCAWLMLRLPASRRSLGSSIDQWRLLRIWSLTLGRLFHCLQLRFGVWHCVACGGHLQHVSRPDLAPFARLRHGRPADGRRQT